MSGSLYRFLMVVWPAWADDQHGGPPVFLYMEGLVLLIAVLIIAEILTFPQERP